MKTNHRIQPATRNHHSSLEILESRIAPASLVGHVLHYTDIDGDHVTVTISKGTIAKADFTFDTAFDNTGKQQLELIDISGAAGVSGANVTVKVTKAPGGDGLAAVGRINATGKELGSVNVAGDLGDIDAGGTGHAPAIKSLSVRTMGAYGLASQGGVGDLHSSIDGGLGALKVKGDLAEAQISVTGKIGSIAIGGSLVGGSGAQSGEIDSTDTIGSVRVGADIRGGSGSNSGEIQSGHDMGDVTVGGSLVGGSGDHTAEIFSTTDMGRVKISHDLKGGFGLESGDIDSGGKIKKVAIGGSLVGDSGAHSGEVTATGDLGPVTIGRDQVGGTGDFSGRIDPVAGNIASITITGSLLGNSGAHSGEIAASHDISGKVSIGHDVNGGTGASSGRITAGGKIGSVTVGGSVHGGTADDTGSIDSGDDMGAVRIGQDLTGGNIDGGASVDHSGVIISSGRIASATIGGSVISGVDHSVGDITNSTTIRADQDIGFLTVKGSVIGNETADGKSPVVFSAKGKAIPTATSDVAFGKITVGGRVEHADILGGYGTDLTAVDGNAQIGAVVVGGDWVASSLVSGATNPGGLDKFGDGNDQIITGGTIAKIANIQIGGTVAGDGSGNHFGFVSHSIGKFKESGDTVPLTGAPDDAPLSPITGDVAIHEI